MEKYIKISDAAKLYSVSTRTLRYYEEIGLFNSLRDEHSNYRVYDDVNLRKLEQIVLLRNLNFSLNDIASMLSTKENQTITDHLTSKLSELNSEVNKLNNIKDILMSIIKIINTSGIGNVSIYNLIREQIYINSRNERLINMNSDIIIVDFGIGIIPLFDRTQNGIVLKKISEMRNELESNLNIKLPLIRVKDDTKLDEFQCTISLKGKKIVDFDLKTTDENKRADEIISNLRKVITENLKEII